MKKRPSHLLVTFLTLALLGAGCGGEANDLSPATGRSSEPSIGECAVPGHDRGDERPAETPLGCDDTVSSEPDAPVSSEPRDTEPAPDPGASPVEPQPGQEDVRAIRWHSAKAIGNEAVRVRFWSGVEPCNVLDHVEVDYSATAVTITLYEGSSPTEEDVACIELALLKETTVELDEPLGRRRLRDGAR